MTTAGTTSTAVPGAEIRGLGQLGVTVRNLAVMTEFYRDSLGLRFLFAAPGMSFFDLEGVRLMLTEPEGGEAAGASILYLRVGDVAAAHAVLLARGVRFEGKPHVVHRAADHELWMAFFRDPEDHLLALMSEIRRA